MIRLNKILKKIKSWLFLGDKIDSETLIEINKVENYFKDPHLLNFLSDYEDLVLAKDSNLYFTTFGINFKNGKVDSVKFYAHILEEMTEDELKKFIPKTKDYFSLIDFKSKGDNFIFENFGTVLEIKFKIGNEQPTFGFFYQLKNTAESFNKIGFPTKLPQDLKKDCISMGINFEYGTNELFKKYYYFNPQSTNKSFFEEKFGVSILKEAQFIEYAESDDFFKVNFYTGEIENFCDKVKTFTDLELKLINYLNSKYQLTNTTYGFYENMSIKSVYFRVSNLNINFNHNRTDTLSRLIKR